MGTLQVSLFGSVQIVHQDQGRAAALTRHPQALLGFLVLHRHRMYSREVLSDLLWGRSSNGTQALACLRTALWRLRRAVEPLGVGRGTYLLTTASGEIGFNCSSNYWLDVETFERATSLVISRPPQGVDMKEVRVAEEALRLYVGDLLEGFQAEWVLQERERLHCMYLNTLAQLMNYYAYHGAYERSIEYGQRILDLDPLREEIHREMMQLYHYTGQRPLVVLQYETCQQILRSELGIAPMRETRELYDAIMTGTDAGISHIFLAGRPMAPDTYQQTLRALRAAQLHISRAIRLTELLASAAHTEEAHTGSNGRVARL